MKYEHTCDDCGIEFESCYEMHRYCNNCVDDRAFATMPGGGDMEYI